LKEAVEESETRPGDEGGEEHHETELTPEAVEQFMAELQEERVRLVKIHVEVVDFYREHPRVPLRKKKEETRKELQNN